MFENLSEKLEAIFKRLKGHGKLTEQNIQEALKEVRIALLEGDVNFKVVKDFIQSVQGRAIGQEVMDSLTPAQQLIKIVKEEITALMGGEEQKINLSGSPPVPIMLVGLHGCGKTTTAGKLARYFQEKKKRPYLIPADVYRPAAIEQLQRLGEELKVDFYRPKASQTPLDICLSGKEFALKGGYDLILIDTAGRLHIDEALMLELREMKAHLKPKEVLLVADAMTGQDAVNIAKSFNERLGIDGIILTKMDGDARGGAALSIKSVTEKPIKFIGVGEKLDALEVFHPDRMASRILGMGDVLTLIEKAEAVFDEKKARELEKKIRKDSFTLEDFRDQLQQVRKMGSLESILGMIPGLSKKMKGLGSIDFDEKGLKRVEAIINSMTPRERTYYQIINGSRRLRIAQGSGTSVQEVNQLLKRYAQARKMMKQFTKMGERGLGRGQMPFFS
ncbi:MAG: signal recognition particle protein [Deltaproteobacteria bacterium RBG_13_47_9]|nr:MAG: signal recognition particle protein [Deltaproteobacteria bacterium RBG_13_47_9]